MKWILDLGAVALGSALGGVVRWGISRWLPFSPGTLPLGTMTVNLAGCLLIGMLNGWFERNGVGNPAIRLLLTTGFCGGLTTFSTFMYENVQLASASHILTAVAYMTVSFAGGLLLAAAGYWLVR